MKLKTAVFEKTRAVKKYLCLCVAALLVLSCFSSCKPAGGLSEESAAAEKSGVLRILADLDATRYGSGEAGKNAMTELLYQIRANNGPKVEVEYVPRSGVEREAKITALQTEIMAGKGPDLFLVACSSPEIAIYEIGGKRPFLFPYVESAMRNHVFLPLDSYIERADHMEWGKLTERVMSAGRTEDGQMVLPMTFDFEATLFNFSDISFYDSLPITFSDAVSSKDPALWAASTYNDTKFGDVLGSLADYETLQLNFSKEELSSAAAQSAHLRDLNLNNGLSGSPYHVSCLFSRHNHLRLSAPEAPSLSSEEGAAIVPLYNIRGGVTANVTSFAAVNAATQHADEAFFVLDLLLSKKLQQSSFFSCVDGVPVDEELLQKTTKVSLAPDDPNPWSFSDAGYQEYCRVRDQINAVKFYSPLDVALTELYHDLTGRESEQEIKAVTDELYLALQTMLAES